MLFEEKESYLLNYEEHVNSWLQTGKYIVHRLLSAPRLVVYTQLNTLRNYWHQFAAPGSKLFEYAIVGYRREWHLSQSCSREVAGIIFEMLKIKSENSLACCYVEETKK